MTPSALKRASLLVTALALVMFSASNLRGQLGTSAPTSPAIDPETLRLIQQVNDQLRNEKDAVPAVPAGTASVRQAGGLPPNRLPRKTGPIPGTDPKRAYSQPTTSNLPTANRNAVDPATSPTLPNRKTNNSPIIQTNYDPNRALTRDGADTTSIAEARRPLNSAASLVVTPPERSIAPAAIGARYGLGRETPIDRIARMEATIFELERENEELRQLNTSLQGQVKQTQDQLMAVIREIQSGRKEIVTARNDLDRMRNDLQILRDKVRAAQKEHSDVLQSMGPLLQQLLESDDVGSLPPNPLE